MKKLSLRLLVLVSLGSSYAIQASEIETPLPGLYGFLRFPIEYFEHHEGHKECPGLSWIVNGIGYARHAGVSYPNCGPRGCTVPYSALVFNKSPFLLSGIFYNSVVPAANANPFLSISELSPLFEFHEKGVIFNVTGEGHTEYCGVPYRYGVVARLPVRDIEVVDIGGVDDMEGLSLGEVFQQRAEEFVPGDKTTNNFVFAARLDFISALNQIAIPPIPMVTYGDGTCANRTTIASEFNGGVSQRTDVGFPCVTDGVNVDPVNGYPSVGLIYRADGTIPSEIRWGDLTSNSQPILAADGSGIPQDGRGRFSDNVNYAAALAGDVSAQSKLFVVPTLTTAAGNPLSLGAQEIQTAITEAVQSVGGGAIDFLDENGIDFRDGRTQGVGDLDVEFFVGRNWEYCENEFFTDLKFVIRFPTADRLCNCKQVLRQPAGNNKHYEVMGGFVGGWDINDRYKFMTDLTVSKVLKANIFAPATFKGSTVKYIGPCITVQTDWWYLVYHADLSVFACEGCGFDLGYELYYKNVDKICGFQKTAIDFFGNDQPIDPSKLAVNTQRLANKARVALFSKLEHCEFLAGWSWVFSGYNSPRDIDWYLSVSAYF